MTQIAADFLRLLKSSTKICGQHSPRKIALFEKPLAVFFFCAILFFPIGGINWFSVFTPLSPKHPQHSTMKDDNLFAETSMSFGEHLEELRKCFFNSL
ncbi:MAG: hypothetical protein LBC02_05305, partial [Planctomycetaceae bacterium]|nr:hypothetical protein [Planctomycetaceae bacterium]